MSTSEVQPRPIVVGIDGSGPGDGAWRWAAVEAARTGSRLRIVPAVP